MMTDDVQSQISIPARFFYDGQSIRSDGISTGNVKLPSDVSGTNSALPHSQDATDQKSDLMRSVQRRDMNALIAVARADAMYNKDAVRRKIARAVEVVPIGMVKKLAPVVRGDKTLMSALGGLVKLGGDDKSAAYHSRGLGYIAQATGISTVTKFGKGLAIGVMLGGGASSIAMLTPVAVLAWPLLAAYGLLSLAPFDIKLCGGKSGINDKGDHMTLERDLHLSSGEYHFGGHFAACALSAMTSNKAPVSLPNAPKDIDDVALEVSPSVTANAHKPLRTDDVRDAIDTSLLHSKAGLPSTSLRDIESVNELHIPTSSQRNIAY